MADEKDEKDDNEQPQFYGGIDYSESGGLGSTQGHNSAVANDHFEMQMYDIRQQDARKEESARLARVRAETERKNKQRREALQRERDAEAEANAEVIKQRYRQKLSGKMTSEDFEKWWKSNKLRLIEEDARESENAFLREAQRGEFGTM
jgi:hypothetical protein